MADVEQNIEQQEPAAPPPSPPERESPQREAPTSRPSIRQSLEKAAEDQRKAEAPADRREGRKGRDRQTGQYTSRARQEVELTEAEESDAAAQEGAEEAAPGTAAPEIAAPEAWSREAKAEWANVPPQVQQAVIKREQDTVKGIENLRANYRDLDAAIAPRLDVLRQTGHTPAQGVNQLFLWFEALTADVERVKRGIQPQAFPALAQSFGIDPRIAYGLPNPAQPQAQPQSLAANGQPAATQAASDQPQIPEQLQQWWNGQLQQLGNVLGQRFGSIEQAMQMQGVQKANDVLEIWSKGKPYFEEVRGTMAQLLQSGLVQPLPNGNADLDKAYDMALYALPEIRGKVLSDQQKAADAQRKAKEAAEKKLQQEQADKARRAAVALGPSAPGAEVKPERKKGKSVRESLQEAIEEASGARR